MRIKTGRLVLLLILTAAITLSLAAMGLWLYMDRGDRVIVEREDYEELVRIREENGKVPKIRDMIRDQYLRDADEDAMMDAAYRAMLESLGDPYSRYMDADEVTKLRDSLNNNFTGIGVTIRATDKGMLIVSVIPGSPAASGGLEAGDIVLRVDGKEYDSLQDLTDAIRGEAGTTLTLEFQRGEEEKTRSVNLVRGQISDVTISSSKLAEDTVGYIRISTFGDKTGADFDAALTALEKEEGLAGLVIDLRDNPGGLLDQGILVADRILPEGLITYTLDAAGAREDFTSDEAATPLKTVILVNEGTASAAEMLAAAAKDYGIPVVGTVTYGKGVVQNTTRFEDGSAVSITHAEYFSPKGASIQDKGVTPDHEVVQPESGEDAQLDAAMKLLKD